jgi:hypothetical protein
LKANSDAVRAYRVINLVLALILSGVFIYTATFTPGHHPLPSGTKIFFHRDSPSTGLTRSFSALTRFHVAEALEYNRYGPAILGFFLLQLCIRVVFYLILPGFTRPVRILYIPDIILSTILFFIVFWPFIQALFSSL